MGILGDLLGLADDIISIPTDFIGLTNHHNKKEALERAKIAFIQGDISAAQFEAIKKQLS